MRFLAPKFSLFFTATRAYSLPISIMSWLVPFLAGVINKGNILYGFIALFGIVVLHLATNIFDDAVDYTREKSAIDSGLKKKFNFQEGKCSCIFNGSLSIKQYYVISFVLFVIPLFIALFFIKITGLNLLYVLIPSAIICMLYPILGCLGLGEILVSVVFSPLIYSGVYFVMTGQYSSYILLISISTGFLAVAVLHNHMLLDFSYDCDNRKITLCRILGSKFKSWILLLIIILASYLNLLFMVFVLKYSYFYLIPLLTIPQAVFLLKKMYIYVNECGKDNFLNYFKLPQNLLTSFTILLCISIVIDKCI